MEMVRNMEIVHLLNSIKANENAQYERFKAQYQLEKDPEKAKEIIEKTKVVIANHKKVSMYLQKYLDLYKLLKESDASKKEAVINNICKLEAAIIKEYGKTNNNIKTTNVGKPLQSGKKYRVKSVAKNIGNVASGTINGGICAAASLCGIGSIAGFIGALGEASLFAGAVGAAVYLTVAVASGFIALTTGKTAKNKFSNLKK